VTAESDDACTLVSADPTYTLTSMTVLLTFEDICGESVSLTGAQIGGIAAGVIVFVAIVAGIAGGIYWHQRKQRMQRESKQVKNSLNKGMKQLSSNDNL